MKLVFSMQVLHVYLFLVPEIRKKTNTFFFAGSGEGGGGGGGGGTGATSTSAMGKVLVSYCMGCAHTVYI